MDARWYSPSQGQFTSADTVDNSVSPNVDNANPYAYADASPLDTVDPTGHLGIGLTTNPFLTAGVATEEGGVADSWNPSGWAFDIAGAALISAGIAWSAYDIWNQAQQATAFGPLGSGLASSLSGVGSYFTSPGGGGGGGGPDGHYVQPSGHSVWSSGSGSNHATAPVCDSACLAARAAAQAAFAAAASKMGRLTANLATTLGTNPSTRPGAASGITNIGRTVAAGATAAVTAAFCTDSPQACTPGNELVSS
jgi:hypothetical protein